jgi:hypothetical protein
MINSHLSCPDSPNSKIDAAIYDLIEQISQFSDNDFDAQWIHLHEDEVVNLVILLIQYLTTRLDGKMLCGLLLQIRQEEYLGQPNSVDIETEYDWS